MSKIVPQKSYSSTVFFLTKRWPLLWQPFDIDISYDWVPYCQRMQQLYWAKSCIITRSVAVQACIRLTQSCQQHSWPWLCAALTRLEAAWLKAVHSWSSLLSMRLLDSRNAGNIAHWPCALAVLTRVGAASLNAVLAWNPLLLKELPDPDTAAVNIHLQELVLDSNALGVDGAVSESLFVVILEVDEAVSHSVLSYLWWLAKPYRDEHFAICFTLSRWENYPVTMIDFLRSMCQKSVLMPLLIDYARN